MIRSWLPALLFSLLLAPLSLAAPAEGLAPDAPKERLALAWEKNWLTIRGPHLPGREMLVWYIEAFCRPGSTDREWKETVIKHTTKLVEASPDGSLLKLTSTLVDGVVVEHTIRAAADEVDFRLIARNRSASESMAHWAQPCIHVDKFIGVPLVQDSEAYLPFSFIFIDGKLTRMPTQPWATKARYVPGQTWCPANVDRNDVNPRPLSALVPSNGLIGCYSADGSMIMASAWEPYQELFQGVKTCLHSDFRIGGLEPGETKTIRGKIYFVKADVAALLERYQRDFPEQATGKK